MARFSCSDEQAQHIKEHLRHPDGRADACNALNDAYDNLEPVKPAGSRLDALAELLEELGLNLYQFMETFGLRDESNDPNIRHAYIVDN
jgi:hypothetical protein